MFSKTKSISTLGKPGGPPSQTVDAASKRNPTVASLIARDIILEGGVTGDGDLHVDGVVRGDIRIGRLTLGETGQVEGSIIAEAVECRGRVVGAITAKQVRLYGSAHVDGDITHEQLAMESGAFFQGRSLKFQRPAPAPAPQVLAEGAAPALIPLASD